MDWTSSTIHQPAQVDVLLSAKVGSEGAIHTGYVLSPTFERNGLAHVQHIGQCNSKGRLLPAGPLHLDQDNKDMNKE